MTQQPNNSTRVRTRPEPDRILPDLPDLHYPVELPITERREEIVRAISDNQVLVITGETGSGKSTQIPKMCLEAGRGRAGLIGCTQPRRIAAVTLAARVSEELRAAGPRLVGYKIRFQDRTSRSNRIKFMTDGILLAEAQGDRLFRAYDTIIVDEAHERSLNIDFLIGILRKLLPRRPDLKVIVTSATIDPEKFSRAFGDAPIIEVSGRTWPVEVRYSPPEEGDEEDESYADRAVAAVERIKALREARGDVLVFMPTESDIRETVQRLEERRFLNTLVLPLFGRMAASDQQRVFQLGSQDKIVVSTNVAETSVTIPRIRYVVDTGVARISQYNARSRTQGLPVARISRASADQRKGRCGRVASGVCIRLYAQEDYLSRPEFTPPEIQRSNLAEVILRMLHLRLGAISEFPFLDPPTPASIKDGFAVLKELGAVDEHRHLTATGRAMARLPLDPRLARMLLEAKKEACVEEIRIIAAALSIMDPRERPAEQEAKADQAQAVFRDLRSDFTGYLKIWTACRRSASDGEDPARTGLDFRITGGRLRKFCREHYLSYRRMREWMDVHEEIGGILEEMEGFGPNTEPAGYDAIHRSVLSGYLSNIAMRREKNIYLAAKNRTAMIFPGSGIFNKGGAWVAAAEIVLTSRLFARTAANIEPEWIEQVGGHLCRSTYFEPHWEKRRGQVVAFERVTLYGLPIVERRKVSYSRINPAEARTIFIRSALVEGDVATPYGFMEHNRGLIAQIEDLESKTRRRDLLVDDEALFAFYDTRLPDIAETRSLDRIIRESGGDGFLRMIESDLLRAEPDFSELEQFPDALKTDDLELPLKYRFTPGAEDDGITLTIPVHALPRVSREVAEWLVPGLLCEKVTHLLKALPKGTRRRLVPVGETARRVCELLPFGQGNIYGQLSTAVQEATGVQVPVWDGSDLPQHLRMRFEIVDPHGKVIGAGRELEKLRAHETGESDDRLLEAARGKFQRENLTSWNFGDLPRKVEVGRDSLGIVREAWLGLAGGSTASIRLFSTPADAMKSTVEGLRRLYEIAFAPELKQLQRAWVFPENLTPMIFFLGGRASADRRLHEYVIGELFGTRDPQWPDRQRFVKTLRELTGRIGSVGTEICREVFDVVIERNITRSRIERYSDLSTGNASLRARFAQLFSELNSLVPEDFLMLYRRESIRQLPRYMNALRIRAERLYSAPEKDRLKAQQAEPHRERYDRMRSAAESAADGRCRKVMEEFGEMLEEFKIGLFAPEVKTRIRVSSRKLEEKWEEWQFCTQSAQ